MASENEAAQVEGTVPEVDDTLKKVEFESSDVQNNSNGAINEPTGEENSPKDEPKIQDSEKINKDHEPDSRDWKARRERDQRSDKERHGDKRHRDGRRHDGRSDQHKRTKIDYSKNVKSKFEDLPESNDPDEIRKQVEFYFSDSNLPSDKFLLSKVGGSANNSVPISIIHSFKRMRHFQPFSAIVEALKSSATLAVVENDTAVQRKTPLPSPIGSTSFTDNITLLEDAARPRSIYAKGFGEEGPSTQFDIEAFFAPYGPTNAIRLRRSAEKHFKGSVFVEFDSAATQAAFLALDPKPRWLGQELQIMSKEAYDKAKADDVAAGRSRKDAHHGHRNGTPRDRGRGGRDGRGRGRGGHGHRERDERRSTTSKGDDDTTPTTTTAPIDDTKEPNTTTTTTTTAATTAATNDAAAPASEPKKRPAPSDDADDADGGDGNEEAAAPAAKKAKVDDDAGDAGTADAKGPETVAEAFAAAEEAGKAQAREEVDAEGGDGAAVDA